MDMGGKKRPGRFTVQFNLGDPQQARTAEILERHGRQKARFISAAILHYINRKEAPQITLPAMPDVDQIERTVLAILEKYTGTVYLPSVQQSSSGGKTPLPREMPFQESVDFADDFKTLLGEGGFSAITNTLISFQKK